MWPATLSPLIQEARDRQRKRRVMLAQLAALMAVLGLAAAAKSPGSGPVTPATSVNSQAAEASIRSVIAEFDSALVSRDFGRACGLLDPWMGMATLRSSTNDVGVRGTCEQRLAGFVRIAGAKLVAELNRGSVASMEVGGSESRGFVAAATMKVADDLVRRNTWAPVVGVAKYAPNAKVLLTCPPLLCAAGFLNEIRARSRSERS